MRFEDYLLNEVQRSAQRDWRRENARSMRAWKRMVHGSFRVGVVLLSLWFAVYLLVLGAAL